MKICRFNENRLGVVQMTAEHASDVPVVRDVSAALAVIAAAHYPWPAGDQLIVHLPALIQRIGALLPHAPCVALADVRLLAPLANPGKIIAAPVNYRKHLQEVLSDPDLHHDNQIHHIERAGLFLKASSSLVGAAHGIRLNQPQRRTDHEVELVAIIGKTAKNIARQNALDYVAGYCVGLDITIRGPEERSFRKSPDSYTVLGPWLTTADELPNPAALDLALDVDGEPRQSSSTSQLILGVAELIELASRFYTLHPGDVLFTGTPEGVAPIQAGQRIRARVQGLGTLEVDVHTEH